MTTISPCKTRSKSRIASKPQIEDDVLESARIDVTTSTPRNPSSVGTHLQRLPAKLTTQLRRLARVDLNTLLKKRQWLRDCTPAFPDGDASSVSPSLKNAVQATLIFAQEEVGTAICLSPGGLILTCSHCIAEEEADLENSKTSWLIFASGQVVKTECIAWDGKRDLALCYIVAAEDDPSTSSTSDDIDRSIPSLPLAHAMPRLNTPMMCVGHPGAEDLESIIPEIQTNYDMLYVSQGRYRGYSPGQDIHDNENIGALRHDCWTYWGHSGAPLVDTKTGSLVGIHSTF